MTFLRYARGQTDRHRRKQPHRHAYRNTLRLHCTVHVQAKIQSERYECLLKAYNKRINAKAHDNVISKFILKITKWTIMTEEVYERRRCSFWSTWREVTPWTGEEHASLYRAANQRRQQTTTTSPCVVVAVNYNKNRT